MTTNQTIDGVPRRLLDRMHSCARGLEASEWAELRALLDAPAPADWQRGLEDADGNELVTVRADEYARLKAAQPQGEPVARLGVHHVLGAIHNVPGLPGVKGNHIHDLTALLNGVLTEAGQPAPVAVVLPERLAQKRFYSDGWNACIDELKRLNPSL